MAVTLPPQSQHQLDINPTFYSIGMTHTLPGSGARKASFESALPSIPSQQQNIFTSPQRWATQQVFQRPTSRSPNFRDRTPIRHNRPDMSRHRSSSQSGRLLAYAEEQVRQAQDVNNDGTTFLTSLDPPLQNYQPQQYSFPPTTSPYMHQQAFYDPNTAQTAYVQMPIPQDPQNTANIYAHGIPPPMTMAQAPAQTLSPNDTLYSQSRLTQLPPVGSVPSNFPPIHQPLESTPNEVEMAGNRQKPQCWDHGCNGRQFSTFSNLLRHQREKSGTASKARCPHCGTEFTRTTARNGHLYGGKCKGMTDDTKDANEPTKEDGP